MNTEFVFYGNLLEKGVSSHKMELFITTGVRTSNPTLGKSSLGGQQRWKN
jgi:hypothetical protein